MLNFKFARCVCAEPPNPSNETLELWMRNYASLDNIPWTNFTVKVNVLKGDVKFHIAELIKKK